jgi:hypothetical protein
LFLIANCAKFKMQKEKSRKKFFYIGKKTSKRSLVILFALVIYTAPTVCLSIGIKAYGCVVPLEMSPRGLPTVNGFIVVLESPC